jgi:hypothetical protein
MAPRRWLRTTPGQLRAWSLAVLSGLIVVGIVVAAAAHARGDAARAAGSAGAPELVASEGLYGSLADADATASIIFLKAGREAPDLRQRYEADIQQAGQLLPVVAKDAGTSHGEQAAIATISGQLPAYAGYVEAARANGLLGYPVGAAYLRQASSLMRTGLLPAAITLDEQAAARLQGAYRSGTSTTELVLIGIAGLLVIGLLVGVQVFTARRSKRVFNPGLVSATIVVLILLGWTIARLGSAQSSLVDAQRKGSDAVQLLSATRILTLEAQSDDNTALIQRDGGQTYVSDFASVLERLRGKGMLLAEARTVAARTGSADRVDQISGGIDQLAALHTVVRRQDDGGNYNGAVATATGAEAQLITRVDGEIATEITDSQRLLDQRTRDARRGFGALTIAIPVLIVLAGLLAGAGFQRRIGDYR